MRIGSLSGMGAMYGISSNYTISSIHGNPRSMNAVDGISEQSESAKPLAIVKPVSEEEQQKIRQKQTMTVADDYETVMAQMMNGRNPENVVSSIAEVSEDADSLSVDMMQMDDTKSDSFNVDDMLQTNTREPEEFSVDDNLQISADNTLQTDNAFNIDDMQQSVNVSEAASQSFEIPDETGENMADDLTGNIAMADTEVVQGSNPSNTNTGEGQAFSYQMQRAIDAYTMAAGF